MAEDLGAIKYSVIADTSDLSKAEAEMDAFGNTAKRSAKDVDKLGDDTKAAGKKGKQGAEELTKGMGGAASAIRLATTALVAFGAAISVREVIQYADSWQNATNQLKTVQKETENLAATQRMLMGISNESRQGFESTANLYTRLTRATESMGLAQGELIDLTNTINKSFAVSGASAQEASNAIIQLSQGLAAGALRGEEFNSVSEQSPILMQAIADNLKMTRGELRAFAADGGITAEIVVDSLQKASAQIDQTFSKMSATFEQNMTVASNNMLEFVGSSELVSGATGTAGAAIVALSENLDTLATVGAAASLMLSARLAGSAVTATGAMLASATAAGTLRTALSLLGGPAGIAALAAFGMYKLVDSYLDHNEAAKQAETASFLLGEGIELTGKEFENIIEKIDRATESLRGYVNAGGALSGMSAQWLKDQAARLAAMNDETVVVEELNEKTLKQIDGLKNHQLALGMTERAQAIFNETLKALANGSGPDAIATAARLAAENYDLEAAQKAAKTELELFNDSIAEYIKEQKDAATQAKKTQESIAGTISKLEQEQLALGMSARAQAIFNATIEAFNNGAAPEQIARIAELTAKNYDLAAANTEAGKAADEAAKQSAEAWQDTHDYLSGAFVDIMNNGGNAFDNIAKAFERTVQRMVAEWAASGLMGLFTGQGTSGFSMPSFGGGGGSSPIGTASSIANIGKTLGSIFGGGSAATAAATSAGTSTVVGSLVGGGVGGVGTGAAAAGAGGGIGAGIAGIGSSIGAAASSAGSAVLGALQAIPGWGWALGGAALAAKLLDDSGTMSGNAGMLIRPVGDGDRQFDVPSFASGFDPVGFARREDQGTATQVIDVFRADDAVLTALAQASGIDVSYSANQFGGFNEKGTGSGLFFGTANEDGKNTAVSLEQQRTQFVSQWLKGLSGQVDSSIISDALGAGSADAMIARAAQLAGIDGSHANGLDRVPFDGYIAQLHKGERVQTASEAANDDMGGNVMMELLKKVSLQLSLQQRWDFDGLPPERATA